MPRLSISSIIEFHSSMAICRLKLECLRGKIVHDRLKISRTASCWRVLEDSQEIVAVELCSVHSHLLGCNVGNCIEVFQYAAAAAALLVLWFCRFVVFQSSSFSWSEHVPWIWTVCKLCASQGGLAIVDFLRGIRQRSSQGVASA